MTKKFTVYSLEKLRVSSFKQYRVYLWKFNTMSCTFVEPENAVFPVNQSGGGTINFSKWIYEHYSCRRARKVKVTPCL